MSRVPTLAAARALLIICLLMIVAVVSAALLWQGNAVGVTTSVARVVGVVGATVGVLAAVRWNLRTVVAQRPFVGNLLFGLGVGFCMVYIDTLTLGVAPPQPVAAGLRSR